MNNFQKNAILISIGGLGYGAIELLWRGHTHPTMPVAGGLTFLAFTKIAEKYKHKPLILKAMLCAASATGIELAFGLVFNKALKMGVWDYSKMPCNFLGQICPTFSLLWCALAIPVLPLADFCNEKIKGTDAKK